MNSLNDYWRRIQQWRINELYFSYHISNWLNEKRNAIIAKSNESNSLIASTRTNVTIANSLTYTCTLSLTSNSNLNFNFNGNLNWKSNHCRLRYLNCSSCVLIKWIKRITTHHQETSFHTRINLESAKLSRTHKRINNSSLVLNHQSLELTELIQLDFE